MADAQNNSVNINGYTYYFTWVDDNGVWRADGPVWDSTHSYSQSVYLKEAQVEGGSKVTGTYYISGYKPGYVLITNSSTATANTGYISTSYMPKASYTISYDANGGSGTPSAQTKTWGTNLTLSSTTPSKTGHTFLGWSTSSSATSATYSAGGTYSSNSGATLYAVWKANQVWIAYDVNGGTTNVSRYEKLKNSTYIIDKELEDLGVNDGIYFHTFTYDTSSVRPYSPNTFGLTKTGYIFKGWSVYGKGSGAGSVVSLLDPNTGYKNTVYTHYADSTENIENKDRVFCWLVANWEEDPVTVTFDANGGECDEASREFLRGHSIDDLPIPTKIGYTFNGWFYEPDHLPVTSTTIFNVNTTLTANWEPNKVNIYYLTNGGTISGSVYGSSYIKINTGLGEKEDIVITYNGSHYLDTIEYGGNLTLKDADDFKLTKTGYNFKGWKILTTENKSILESGSEYSSDTFVQYNDASKNTLNQEATNCYLQAQWEIKTYTIKYDYGKDGLTNPEPQTKTYDESHIVSEFYQGNDVQSIWVTRDIQIPTNIPEDNEWDIHISTLPVTYRVVYKQTGWKTPSGDVYKSGDKYEANRSTTLTAVWEMDHYKFTLPTPESINGYEFQYYLFEDGHWGVEDVIDYHDYDTLVIVYKLLATISNVGLEWNADGDLRLHYNYILEDDITPTNCIIKVETGVSDSMDSNSVDIWSDSYEVDKHSNAYASLSNIPQLEDRQFIHVRAYVEENNKKHSCISKYKEHIDRGYTVSKIQNTLVDVLEGFNVGDLEK